jgi:glycosyltransferase involved in cell wall biosynthesis
MVCSLRTYKGIFEFLKIAKNCLGVTSVKFKLVLNALPNEVSEFENENTIPENVELYSSQKDLDAFYKNASLLLNLSRIDEWVETFGLTIIEAMGYGIPVIVPPVGGPSEIVTNNKEGFLISSYETEKISNKIKELYNNKDLCLALSKNAILRVSDFSESNFNKQILNFIDE